MENNTALLVMDLQPAMTDTFSDITSPDDKRPMHCFVRGSWR
jgi:hypothetical protein